MAANPKPVRKELKKVTAKGRELRKKELPNKEVRKTRGKQLIEKVKKHGGTKHQIHAVKSMV